MREQILNEIRRLAERSNGLPPGEKTFAAATGIQKREWHGQYWARWGDACAEAGFTPNTASQKISDDLILQKLAEARSEEHTSELQSLMRISYADFCFNKTKQQHNKSIQT